MDKEPGNDLLEDMIRESLISISYRVPDSELNTEKTPEHVEGKVEPLIDEGDKGYMSKLISISESPDVQVPPLLPGELDD